MIGNTTAILITLRALLTQLAIVGDTELEAYIVPSVDAHHSEYVSTCDARRAYITNFDGSAGTAVVTSDYALLWTDSRYFLQAEQQLNNTEWILMKQGDPGVPSVSGWLTKNLTKGQVVGVDPSLYTKTEWDSLSKELSTVGVNLTAVETNLVDQVWGEDRPPCSQNPVLELGIEFAGKNVSTKLDDVRKEMNNSNADVLVVCDLDEVAWLLNLRGSDIDYNPFFFSYVIVTPDSFELFIGQDKLNRSTIESLEDIDGVVHDYTNVTERLEAKAQENPGKIWLSKNCNYLLVNRLQSELDRLLIRLTPIALMKAIKNNIEVQGLINAHVRDGAAVVEYFAWLENEMKDGTELTEISAATKLEEFRSKQDNFAGLSFESISASGPNAALPHYSPSNTSDRKLSMDEIYLVDSGGQYFDGTTDVTRTIYFGVPKQEIKDAFTRVLKGVISLRTAIFPRKSVGSVLDTLARKALWDVKLDYGHGTGHGVGAYLGVHEGPFSIGSRTGGDDPGLDVNMFTSDEPGYYKEGDFGIRTENVIRIVNATETSSFLTFEDVTLVPIQLKLINPALLTADEITYLDTYHENVKKTVGASLKKNGASQLAIDWLAKETVSIGSYFASASTQLTATTAAVTSLLAITLLGHLINLT